MKREEKECMQMEEFCQVYAKTCREEDLIADGLPEQFGVQRGLRDKQGNGVLAGLTSISKSRHLRWKTESKSLAKENCGTGESTC